MCTSLETCNDIKDWKEGKGREGRGWGFIGQVHYYNYSDCMYMCAVAYIPMCV